MKIDPRQLSELENGNRVAISIKIHPCEHGHIGGDGKIQFVKRYWLYIGSDDHKLMWHVGKIYAMQTNMQQRGRCFARLLEIRKSEKANQWELDFEKLKESVNA